MCKIFGGGGQQIIPNFCWPILFEGIRKTISAVFIFINLQQIFVG
jgi:hypothetical protein